MAFNADLYKVTPGATGLDWKNRQDAGVLETRKLEERITSLEIDKAISGGTYPTDFQSSMHAVATGSNNSYDCVFSPAFDRHLEGVRITFVANHNNLGPVRIKMNNLGYVSVLNMFFEEMLPNRIMSGNVYEIMYQKHVNAYVLIDGTQAVNQNPRDNAIVNGQFNVWQRSHLNSIAYTSVANDEVTADMWRWQQTGPGVVDITQDRDDVPATSLVGARLHSSFRIDVTTIDSAIGNNDFYGFLQRIEGQMYGHYHGQPVTFSFWVKGNKTGTYAVAFLNSANNRSYIAEYTIDATNSWEQKTIQFTFEDTGTWLFNNGIGCEVFFCLAVGNNNEGSVGWQSTGDFGTDAQLNFMDSTDNYIKYSGISLNLGGKQFAYPFRPIDEEMDICRRYLNVTGGVGWTGYVISSSRIIVNGSFCNIMRIAPTATLNGNNSTLRIRHTNNTIQDLASISLTGSRMSRTGGTAQIDTTTTISSTGVRCGTAEELGEEPLYFSAEL